MLVVHLQPVSRSCCRQQRLQSGQTAMREYQEDDRALARTARMTDLPSGPRQGTTRLEAAQGSREAGRSPPVPERIPAVRADTRAEIRSPWAASRGAALGRPAPCRLALPEGAAACPRRGPGRRGTPAALADLEPPGAGTRRTDTPRRAPAGARRAGCRGLTRSSPGVCACGCACGGAGGCARGTGCPAPLDGAGAFSSSGAAAWISTHHRSSSPVLLMARRRHFAIWMLCHWQPWRPWSDSWKLQPALRQGSPPSLSLMKNARETAMNSPKHPAWPVQQQRLQKRWLWLEVALQVVQQAPVV
mmetsp:Transcript_20828/g.58721  ORF Transcript_20828/g.58721 Transcript_20828/m.58721 type:complete len:303 (-) Transcript_20828:982-1890(-)